MSQFNLIGFSSSGANVFNNLTITENGAMVIPYGVSSERPVAPVAGMLRYDTFNTIMEFYNGTEWVPVGAAPPEITSVTENYFNINSSGEETNTNTFTITGNNFDVLSSAFRVIGNNGAGTIITPTIDNFINDTNGTMFFDISGTIQLKDISNELPFAVKVINQNNQTFTYSNAIIATNLGPDFTQPNVFDPSKFQEFAVQDPCANFIVAGQDLSETKHYPLTFTFKPGTGTAGGFNVAGGDISQNGPLSDSSNSTVKVPAGYRLTETAGNYTFTMEVTDDDNAKSEATFRLGVNNPTITSIDPSYIAYSDTPIDISLVGNYFITDSSCSFQNQSGGAILTQSSTQYDSSTNIIAKSVNISTAGTYDINFNNGSVALSTSNPFLTLFVPTLTINSTTYTVQSNGTFSPTPSFTAGSSASGLNYNMTSNITYPYKFTLKGGGGGGGSGGSGNGGQGGTTVGYFYVQSGITYKLLVGAPGQKRGPGQGAGQSSFPGGAVAGPQGYAGTGGGYTGIFNSTTINQSNALLIAGAGGGGSWESKAGGQGGGSSGQAGQNGANTGGGGGTQVAGGAASNVSGSQAGSALQGGGPGTSGDQGGGGAGGGGWFGGGGGSGNGTGAAGGGGSGYIGGNNSSLGTGQTSVGGGGSGGTGSQGNLSWAGAGSIVIETI